MMIRYPVKLERAVEGGFLVSFPDVPEAITEGDTEEEALFNAAEALSGILASKLDHGEDVPVPSIVRGASYVAPDAKTQAALLVRLARGGKPLAELARALETSWPSAARLEDPRHWPSLRQLDKAATAMGKKLILSLE